MKHLILLIALSTPPLLAQKAKPNPQPPIATKSESLASQPLVGRFQLIMLGPVRADQYLLDTVTGRAWTIVVDTENRFIFKPVRFVNASGEISWDPETDADHEKELKARTWIREYGKTNTVVPPK